MATRQLPLFGAQARAKRACFYSLHPSEKTGKFSAYTPKAMKFFSAKYGIPIVDKPEDLAALTPHAEITTPADRVRCPVEHAELSALGCASRHVAREYRGHRHGHDVAAAARHPACAGCELGAVAASRLGIPGTPGRRPVRSLPVVTEPVHVRVSPRSRAQPGLVDDIPAANLRVVPHPRDVHATGRYPWV